MHFAAALSLFVLALAGVTVEADPCGGADWRYSPHNSKCYKLFPGQTGWTAAEFKCISMGGHHISIGNAVDNKFVSELARQAGVVWLGAAQFGGSTNYVWSDQSPFVFENWQTGTRPAFHRGKKCIKLDGNTGQWIQSCCKVPAAMICQKQGQAGAAVGPAPLPGRIVEDGSGLAEAGFKPNQIKKLNEECEEARRRRLRFKRRC